MNDSDSKVMLGGLQISLVALFVLVASRPGTTGAFASILLIVVGTVVTAYPFWGG